MASDDGIRGVTCNAILEKLGSNGEVASVKKFPNSNVSIIRISGSQIGLSIQYRSVSINLEIEKGSLKVFGKFLKDGKATLNFKDKNGNRRVLISNAPVSDLEKTLKLLMVKHKIAPASKIKPSLLKNEIDEISPIRPRELAEINGQLNKPKDGTPTKNTTPVRKLKRRQRAAADQGLMKPKRLSQPEKILTNNQLILNDRQQEIITTIKGGQSIFFTGAAGTGKSFILKELLKSVPTDSTAVTASTGCAAVHINGQTLHGWAGVGIEIRPLQVILDKMHLNKKLIRNWKNTEILIIDEISMVDADFFDYLESIARQLKDIKKPFGGIQLVLCGDFLQLPPVSKGQSKPKFCFQAKSWSECVTARVELREVYRQAADPEFCKLLNNMRVGQIPAWAEKRLKESYNNHADLNVTDLLPTQLMTHNNQVDAVNKREYEKLKTNEKVFYAVDSMTSQSDKFKKVIDSILHNVPRKLDLKKGAQVMLTRNISLLKGLVNGSRGVVIGFEGEANHPIIKFYVNGEKMVIKREKFSFALNDKRFERVQYPLTQAWAMSIHKSQGMSLDLASVSLARCFEAGQAYVALSRCRSFKGLRVIDFNLENIRASPEALEFHNF